MCTELHVPHTWTVHKSYIRVYVALEAVETLPLSQLVVRIEQGLSALVYQVNVPKGLYMYICISSHASI